MKYNKQFSIDFSHNILFSRSIFDINNKVLNETLSLSKNNKCFFLIEKNIKNYFPQLKENIRKKFDFSYPSNKTFIKFMKGEEKIKNNIQKLYKVIYYLNKYNICRHSCVFIIGGGAFLDAIGFACSIFHRGIRHIRIPTTFLSQCDGGVGVKNSINYLHKKNLLRNF